MHRIMDIQRQMDLKFQQFELEQQVVLEMEERNRQWPPSPSFSTPPDTSPLLLRTRPGEEGGRKGEGEKDAGEPVDEARRRRWSGHADHHEPRTPEAGAIAAASNESTPCTQSQLFWQNSIEYLKSQLEEREAEVRALSIQYKEPARAPTHVQAASKNTPVTTATASAPDLDLCQKLSAQETLVDALALENSRLREEVGRLGEGCAGAGAFGGVECRDAVGYAGMVQRVCVLVPDDKRSVQQAVLQVRARVRDMGERASSRHEHVLAVANTRNHVRSTCCKRRRPYTLHPTPYTLYPAPARSCCCGADRR